MASTKNKVRARILFFALLGLLALQTLIEFRYGEPYPAVSMPVFAGGGWRSDGKTELARTEVIFETKKGESVTLPWNDVLSNVPSTHRQAISALLLRKQREKDGTLAVKRNKHFSKLFLKIFPGYRYASRQRFDAHSEDSMREWMEARGRLLLPDKELTRARIEWTEQTLSWSRASASTSPRRPVAVMKLDFGGSR